MKTTLIFIATILLGSISYGTWDLNDVSYLMPLPSSLKQDPLLKISSRGVGGPLLKTSSLLEMPPLVFHLTEEEIPKALRAVAVRIDPCFPLPTPMDCQKQVRIVWQPMELNRKDEVQTVDAALHSFYKLTDDEFNSLLNEIEKWKLKYKVETAGLPLQVHPAWQNLNEQRGALLEFNQILLQHIGARNFIRVTIMVLRGAGNMWAFANFEPQENGKLRAQAIARLDKKFSQTFINLAVPADHFEGGGIFPKPQGEDTINTLFEEPSRVPPVNEDVIVQEFKALYRIENPRHFSPENMDCVSCHVTQPAKHFFLKNRPNLKLDEIWNSIEYKNSKYNLENKTANPLDTQVIRAFGYFGQQIVISQRVINESAEVADHLNQKLPQE